VAISYSLELATPASAAQVADELCAIGSALALFGASVTPRRLRDEGAATVLGTWIRVIEARPPAWNPVVTDLGFTPTVSVAFRMDKETEISVQQDDMVKLVSRLFDRVAGDAVLHSGYEAIWLIRRHGELSLSEQADLWPERRLAAVAQSYRRETYTFAEE
jgi:hypothetical protein